MAGNPGTGPWRAACGVDVGASLAKLAWRDERGRLDFRLLPSQDLDAVVEAVQELGAGRCGLTGGGAAEVAARLAGGASRVNEFAAWGAGARALLRRSRVSFQEPFLLVSVGTGTSVMLVDGMAVSRVGGTALGGGAVLGLGRALAGPVEFDELCALAARGARARVDLLVSDIYGAGEIALAGDLTAAHFGRLARPGHPSPEPADLVAGVMGLVGENVALVTAGLAAASRVERVVFAGSTLRGNPVLGEVLVGITTLLGRQGTVLEEGEFAGAVGALELGAAREPVTGGATGVQNPPRRERW